MLTRVFPHVSRWFVVQSPSLSLQPNPTLVLLLLYSSVPHDAIQQDSSSSMGLGWRDTARQLEDQDKANQNCLPLHTFSIVRSHLITATRVQCVNNEWYECLRMRSRELYYVGWTLEGMTMNIIGHDKHYIDTRVLSQHKNNRHCSNSVVCCVQYKARFTQSVLVSAIEQ